MSASTTTDAPCPALLAPLPENVPSLLRELTRWVCWRLVWRLTPRGGQWTKVPVDPKTGGNADTMDRGTWGTLEVALARFDMGGVDGIGIVLGDGLAGVDLDKCRDPATGVIDPSCEEIARGLDSYSEISVSGTGVHVLLLAKLPPGGRRKGPVEMYDAGRYFTFSGHRLEGTPAAVLARQEALDALHAKTFTNQNGQPQADAPHDRPPEPDDAQRFRDDLSDDQIVELASRATNGEKFSRLWGGDTAGYPSESEADAALVCLLAFFTGPRPDRIEALFSQSGLAKREKWARSDYRKTTIESALRVVQDFYEPKRSEGAPAEAVCELPEFPVGALPEWIRKFVEAVAVDLQVPVDLPAILALGALAAAVQGKIEVEPKPGYREPLNLYIACVLESGERKSAAMKHFVGPIHDFEQTLAKELEPEINKNKSELGYLQSRVAHLRKIAAKSGKEEAKDNLFKAEKALAEVPRLVTPRFLADDVTSEKLSGLMAEHDGRMAIFSPEGGLFGTIGGRYQNGVPNLDLVLKAHAGDPVHIDRVGRPPVSLDRPALTLTFAVQLDVLNELHKTQGFRGRGFLARFCYLIPKTRMGSRNMNPPRIEETIANRYHAGMTQILRKNFVRPDHRQEGDQDPVVIGFSSVAKEAWLKFAWAVEVELRANGALEALRDWGGKFPGLVARIAGLIHVAEGTNEQEISQETVLRAIEIGQYLAKHAQRVLGRKQETPQQEEQRELLEWIHGKGGTVTAAQLAREGMRLFRGQTDLAASALFALAARGDGTIENPPASLQFRIKGAGSGNESSGVALPEPVSPGPKDGVSSPSSGSPSLPSVAGEAE